MGYCFQNQFNIIPHFTILKSQNSYPKRFKEFIPIVIIRIALHCKMDITIKFNTQPAGRTIKIENIMPYRKLPAPFHSIQFAGFYTLP